MHDMTSVVNRLLFERWDPMGISAEPGWPRDEYEGYVAGILALVVRHASDDVVAEHLARIEEEWMGLEPMPLQRRVAIAAEIREVVRGSANERWTD